MSTVTLHFNDNTNGVYDLDTLMTFYKLFRQIPEKLKYGDIFEVTEFAKPTFDEMIMELYDLIFKQPRALNKSTEIIRNFFGCIYEQYAKDMKKITVLYVDEDYRPEKTQICDWFAYCGNMRGLKWMHEKRLLNTLLVENEFCKKIGIEKIYVKRYGKNICYYAAKYGHLKCLKYAHEIGCRLNSDACENAARSGHLECFKYAFENSICEKNKFPHVFIKGWGNRCPSEPFNKCEACKNTLCVSIALYGQYECLQYAHEHGCPMDKKICLEMEESGRKDYINKKQSDEDSDDMNVHSVLDIILFSRHENEKRDPVIIGYSKCKKYINKYGVSPIIP